MKHTNNGNCPKCKEIMDEYPGLHVLIRDWFTRMQSETPEFHCADAGRGYLEQETYFKRRASNAHYGQSAHNWNCAIDTFFMFSGIYSVDLHHYVKNIEEHIPEWIQWGHNWASFKETPHFELKAWKMLRDSGELKLVEEHFDNSIS